jgi:hypothetical protein
MIKQYLSKIGYNLKKKIEKRRESFFLGYYSATAFDVSSVWALFAARFATTPSFVIGV